jgi:hypothetical protein
VAGAESELTQLFHQHIVVFAMVGSYANAHNQVVTGRLKMGELATFAVGIAYDTTLR